MGNTIISYGGTHSGKRMSWVEQLIELYRTQPGFCIRSFGKDYVIKAHVDYLNQKLYFYEKVS